MARELIRRRIDGLDYEFSQMGAKHSLKTLTKLIKIMGEPLTLGFSALGKKENGKSLLDREINGDILGKAVRALCEKLDEDVVLEIVEQLTSENAMCGGKRIVFHEHYEGRLGHLFKVLGAALEVQYGDFFGVLKESQGALRTSTTPDQST